MMDEKLIQAEMDRQLAEHNLDRADLSEKELAELREEVIGDLEAGCEAMRLDGFWSDPSLLYRKPIKMD